MAISDLTVGGFHLGLVILKRICVSRGELALPAVLLLWRSAHEDFSSCNWYLLSQVHAFFLAKFGGAREAQSLVAVSFVSRAGPVSKTGPAFFRGV